VIAIITVCAFALVGTLLSIAHLAAGSAVAGLVPVCLTMAGIITAACAGHHAVRAGSAK